MLDPYEVHSDWFESVRPKAEHTLLRLRLRDDERVIRQRREWYRMYQSREISLEGLRKKAPLIARAVEFGQIASARPPQRLGGR